MPREAWSWINEIRRALLDRAWIAQSTTTSSSDMKPTPLLFGALATLVAACTHASEPVGLVKCPESPTVEESFRDVDAGWEVVRDEGKRGVHLTSISVYDGHPSGMATLVPNAASEKNKKRISRWNLTPNTGAGYWVACNYSNTLLMVAKRVPSSASTCEVSETLLPNGRSIAIDSVRCY